MKMNNMEQIKVGDIVRVSEEASVYTTNWLYDWEANDSIVTVIEGEDAIIISKDDENNELAIPTKYLIKANAEPKEPEEPKAPKYKKGQKMIMPSGDVAIITDVNYSSEHPYSLLSLTDENKRYWTWGEDRLEPYTEPVEPTEKSNFGRIAILVEADLTDSFWDAYTADLAKELAVQMVKSNRNIYEKIGNMAVSVAKSVVENLKKREE